MTRPALSRNEKAEHTPGPWTIGRSADGTPLVMVPVPTSEGSGFGVAHINRLPRMGSVRGDMDANARLIAAAPDLLAAAKRVLAHLNARLDAAVAAEGPVPLFDGIADLHDAIAKAESPQA
jgi:hypothetical protein